VNLVQAAKQGDRAQKLVDGAVVIVAKRALKPIFVMGLVRKPGEFRLPASQDLYVLDALALAGGRTMQLADKVIVRRQVPGRIEPVVIELSVAKAKRNAKDNIRLAEGDLVSVEQTPVTVTMDALRSFVRVAVGGSVALF
jgi:polysaccharide export outer membrane protein